MGPPKRKLQGETSTSKKKPRLEDNEETSSDPEQLSDGSSTEEPIDEIDIVHVNHNGETYEVEIETDGAIGLSTIGQVLPEGFKVRGLQFKNPATGKTRLVTLNEGRLGPPRNGWGRIEYNMLSDIQQGNSKDQEEQSAKVKQENGDKEEESVRMTQKHRAILEKNKAALASSMIPAGVMMHLRRMAVMTVQDQEDIEHGKGPRAQTAALVDFILKQDDDAFEKFREALLLNKQPFLAHLLHP